MYNEELKEIYLSLQESIGYKKKKLDEELSNALVDLQNGCSHKDKNGNLTIEYDSSYEMRSSDMHCTQCGKEGSRTEFEKLK